MEMLLLKLSAKEMVDLAPAYEGCKSTRVQHQTGVGNRVPRSPWSAPCGVFAYPQIQRFQYLFVSVPDTSIAETLCSRKHGQDIRYASAEITGSYPVRTNSKSHNCCAETGKRVCCGTALGRYRTRVS